MGREIKMGQKHSQISDLKPGDHIYTRRAGGTYTHHGIYIGEEMVIHLIPDPKKTSGFSSFASSVSSRPSGERCSKCGFSPEKDGGIVKTCLDCFLKGDIVHVFVYGVPIAWLDSMTRLTPLPAEEVVQRAIKLYEEKTTFGDYNVLINNCEHFAIYCKSGVRLSKQATSIIPVPPTLRLFL